MWMMLGGMANEGGWGGVLSLGVWALVGEGPLPGAASVVAQQAPGQPGAAPVAAELAPGQRQG